MPNREHAKVCSQHDDAGMMVAPPHTLVRESARQPSWNQQSNLCVTLCEAVVFVDTLNDEGNDRRSPARLPLRIEKKNTFSHPIYI